MLEHTGADSELLCLIQNKSLLMEEYYNISSKPKIALFSSLLEHLSGENIKRKSSKGEKFFFFFFKGELYSGTSQHEIYTQIT